MTSIDNTDQTVDADPAAPDGRAPDGADPQPAGGSRAVTDEARAVTEAALFEAFGGLRGMVETTVPGLVFVAIYTIHHDITSSGIAALALSVLMGVARIAQRDTLKHAFSGIFGVAFGAVFAMMSGNAKNFYLPGMLYTLGLAIAYIVTAAARCPAARPDPRAGLQGEPVLAHPQPGRLRAYTKASWAWGLILLAKSAILFPLYWWGNATQLGWVKVALGIPPFLLSVYLTWIFLVKAPPPIDVIAEMEAEEQAAKEREESASSS